ncbi:M56 family metallopeptidase [Myxococcaceae bacterium JPH2]|nr:M56 family metallopeptidase [Myxococcaceae bacterium JPH2]
MSGHVWESLGWALLHSLWQGAVVAVLLAMALAAVGKNAARARYGFACAAMLTMLALPAVTAWHHAATSQGPVAESHVAPRARHAVAQARPVVRAESPAVVEDGAWMEQARTRVAENLPWLVLAWVLGVAVGSARLATGWLRVQRLARQAVPAPEEWQARLDALSRRMGLRRAVRLLQSASLDVPAAVGWLSPVVLLPVTTLTGLPAKQLEMVLAHELAHIRRHDFAVNLAQVLVETLLFYHPAIWWMTRVVRVERENCCDDIAVASGGNSVSYARALTALESLRVLPMSEPTPALSALGGSLPQRVRRLIASPKARCSSRWVAGASVLTLVSSLAVAAPLTSLVLGQAPVPPTPPSSTPLPSATRANPETADAARGFSVAPPPTPLAQGLGSRPTPPRAPRRPVAAVTAPPAAPLPTPPVPPLPALPAFAAQGNPLPTPQPMVQASPHPTPHPQPHPGRDSDDDGDEDSDEDDRTEVGKSELTVDQLIELKIAGVTPERVNEMKSMGYTPTVSALVDMGHAGITAEYARDMNTRFGRKLDTDDLVAMHHLGVTPEFIAALKSQGFSVSDPDEVQQARAVGVDEAYIRGLKSAGYSGLSLEDLVQLRAVGVDPAYIGDMSKLGLSQMDADTLVQMRSVGITPAWLTAMRKAGFQTKDTDELVQLRVLNITPEFVRELKDAGMKDLSVDELVQLRNGGVDAEFIRKLRGPK